MVGKKLSQNHFRRRLHITELLMMTMPVWTRNKYLHGWRQERPGFRGATGGTDLAMVRCSTQFQQTVMQPLGKSCARADYGHAADVLRRILGHFIPCIKEIFHKSLMSPLCVLELNDWEMEKTMIWWVIAISKCLGGSWTPIAEWPLRAPDDVLTAEPFSRA